MDLPIDAPTARRLLAVGRAGIGALAVAAPKLTGGLLGIDPDANPGAVYLTRMFGIRELFMASPFLFVSDRLDEVELTRRAVPVDAVDAVAALLAGATGAIPWRSALPGVAVAAGATYVGYVASED